MRRVISLICFLIFLFPAITQAQDNDAQRFQEAKSLMLKKNYTSALELFRPLTRSVYEGDYSIYASFYFGYCAYKNGNLAMSKSMFKQVQQRFPNWDKSQEVTFWLAQISFDENEYIKALSYVNKIKNKYLKANADAMTEQYVLPLNVNTVEELQVMFVKNITLANLLAKKINALPVSIQNRTKLEFLIREYNLDEEAFGFRNEVTTIKKNNYDVSLMLPFRFSKDSVVMNDRKKDFVYSMYEGMKMANSELKSEGINLDFFLYDTYRSFDSTALILKTDSIYESDVIVGPLYSDPNLLVDDYSYRKKINRFNPVSTNTDLIEDNPYSFLFMPSVRTQAIAAAKFARSNFTSNRNVYIVYGNKSQDSISAYAYKNAVEQDSLFDVVFIKKYDKLTANDFNKMLSASQEVSDLELDANGYEVTKDSLLIAEDSIGHIFVASDEELLASSVLTGIDSRPDSIKVIGPSAWLNYKFLSLKILEQRPIYMIAPEYVDYKSDTFKRFKKNYIKEYNTKPNRYSIVGYEFIHFLGKMLNEYGTHFQNVADKGFMKGKLMYGFDFEGSQDNQSVPIVEFKGSELKLVNKEQAEIELRY